MPHSGIAGGVRSENNMVSFIWQRHDSSARPSQLSSMPLHTSEVGCTSPVHRPQRPSLPQAIVPARQAPRPWVPCGPL